MTNLYSVDQIRKLEALIMQTVPEWSLMQQAGKAVFRFIRDSFAKPSRYICIVGGGNNGGDALVVAALLKQVRKQVQVRMVTEPDRLSGTAAKAFELAKANAVAIEPFDDQETTEATDIIIDGLLGIGLSSPCRQPALSVIEWINRQSCPVVAIDLPSGLNADTGCIMGAAVEANHTITMLGAKLGLYTADGPDYGGQVHIASLGLEQLNTQMRPVAQTLATHDYHLPARKQNTHKGNYGHVLIVGGNQGMGGAAAMAGLSALRAGAGLVSMVVHSTNVAAILPIVPEAMIFGLDTGPVDPSLIDRASFVVLGPGLGHDDWAHACFQQLMAARKPMLIDAQGLSLLAEQSMKPMESFIMTPHPGEAGLLLGKPTESIQSDRMASVRQIQRQYGGVCVLKGRGTLISDGSDQYLCKQGNPGMATAGMGDVLSGMIAALAAQGHDISYASRCGVLLHAMAGDEAAQRTGQMSMLARDLIDCIPGSIARLS